MPQIAIRSGHEGGDIGSRELEALLGAHITEGTGNKSVRNRIDFYLGDKLIERRVRTAKLIDEVMRRIRRICREHKSEREARRREHAANELNLDVKRATDGAGNEATRAGDEIQYANEQFELWL